MKSIRKKEGSVYKKSLRKIFKIIILVYLLVFAVSQLHSPTQSSFNDVIKVEGTLLIDDYLPIVEDTQGEKKTSIDN